MTRTVEQHLVEMQQITLNILSIDFDDEANHGLLFSLQNKQRDIRKEIEIAVAAHSHAYSQHEFDLLSSCMDLERQIAIKLSAQYAEVKEKVQQISNGKRSRHAYQSDSIQHYGYFIDSHK
jgi:hypothetical protein